MKYCTRRGNWSQWVQMGLTLTLITNELTKYGLKLANPQWGNVVELINSVKMFAHTKKFVVTFVKGVGVVWQSYTRHAAILSAVFHTL
jgi:hypothetical protein